MIAVNDQPSKGHDRGFGQPDEWILSAPFLDREFASPPPSFKTTRFISLHPAAIVLGSLLLRLSKRITIERAVAQVFSPVSEIGPKAIEELQRQTVNLLSFQKIPEAVFGGQLAFNVLPRLGRSRRGSPGTYRDVLTDLEDRVRTQLQVYLAGRAPVPAVRVIQAPVFYSLAASLYIEPAGGLPAEQMAQILAGERTRVSKLSEQAPSQVQATGTDRIMVDAIAADAENSNGIWIWAAVDNMRLAAINAVEIAEQVVRHNESATKAAGNHQE